MFYLLPEFGEDIHGIFTLLKKHSFNWEEIEKILTFLHFFKLCKEKYFLNHTYYLYSQ